MLVESTSAMRTMALDGIAHWRLETETRNALEALFSHRVTRPNALASNMSARLAAGNAAVSAILEMHRTTPGLRFYHATFFDDRCRTRNRRVVIDTTAFTKNVRELLRREAIREWVGVLEFQPYVNWKAGEGTVIAPHMHVLFWSTTPLPMRSLEADLRASGRLQSLTDAPTVTITHRGGEGQIAHMAAYLLKAPERGANAYSRAATPGQVRQRDARQREDQAVRLMEVLSHYSMRELVLSSGKPGREVANLIRRAAERATVGRSERSAISRGEVAEVWRRARTEAAKSSYDPIKIVR